MENQQSIHELAVSLATATIENADIVAEMADQIHHRINILAAWFKDIETARKNLADRRILEFGCGQGDMTVALANFVQTTDSDHGRIFAVDPGPLDYGSPVTLGNAQAHITLSKLGRSIQWIQEDPLESLNRLVRDADPDFVVLAHSIYYLPSETYFASLLKALHQATGSRKDGKQTKLLLSEWGMRSSDPAAEAHMLAVEAQAKNPLSDGNVRTLMLPERIRVLAEEAGWQLQREAWLERPVVDDGHWEVRLAQEINLDEASEECRVLFDKMLEASKKQEKVRSMDVWTAVFTG